MKKDDIFKKFNNSNVYINYLIKSHNLLKEQIKPAIFLGGESESDFFVDDESIVNKGTYDMIIDSKHLIKFVRRFKRAVEDDNYKNAFRIVNKFEQRVKINLHLALRKKIVVNIN